MYYSISFTYDEPTQPLFFDKDIRLYGPLNTRNTWIDWHLIPLDRPSVATPEVRTKTVEVPGMNGDLDFTESLTGYPVYNNREGDIEFMVETGHESWNEIYQSMCSYFHGRKVYLAFEDDPGYYYHGRITVDQYQSQKDNSKITIHYNMDPQKYEYCNGRQGDAWWDIFDFESDDLTGVKYTNNLNQVAVDSVDYVDICRGSDWGNLSEFPMIPTIHIQLASVTDSVTLHFVNLELGINFTKTFSSSGYFVVPQMIISQNNNTGKTIRIIRQYPFSQPPYPNEPLRYLDMNYGDSSLVLEAKGTGLVSVIIKPGRK